MSSSRGEVGGNMTSRQHRIASVYVDDDVHAPDDTDLFIEYQESCKRSTGNWTTGSVARHSTVFSHVIDSASLLMSEDDGDTGGLSRSLRNVLFVIMCAVNFSTSTCFAIIAPFFPIVASEKGVSMTYIGGIFAVFQGIQIITSPIFGSCVYYFGPKALYMFGAVVSCVTTLAFGFTIYLNDVFAFSASTFLLRCLQGIGCSAYLCASFVCLANFFPKEVSTKFGILETFAGLGYMIGPPLGGILFEFGGFFTPFVVMSVLLFVLTLASFFLLPKSLSHSLPSSSEGNDDRNGILAFLSLFAYPNTVFTIFVVFIATLNVGFIDPTLAPHLATFDLSSAAIGAVFMALSLAYTVTASLVGDLVNMCSHAQRVGIMLLATLACATSLFLSGPFPLLQLPSSVPQIVVCQVLLGFGFAFQLVTSFCDLFHQTLFNGYPDNINTHGICSGLYACFISAGAFTGPLLAGFLLDKTSSFAWSSSAISLLNVIVVFLLLFYLALHLISHRKLAPNISSKADEGGEENAALLGAAKKDVHREYKTLSPNSNVIMT